MVVNIYTFSVNGNIGSVSCLQFLEKQLGKARDHFLYASDPENFAALLVEMAGSEKEGADTIITHAVLQ